MSGKRKDGDHAGLLCVDFIVCFFSFGKYLAENSLSYIRQLWRDIMLYVRWASFYSVLLFVRFYP